MTQRIHHRARLLSRFGRDERGTTMVELAIVLPFDRLRRTAPDRFELRAAGVAVGIGASTPAVSHVATEVAGGGSGRGQPSSVKPQGDAPSLGQASLSSMSPVSSAFSSSSSLVRRTRLVPAVRRKSCTTKSVMPESLSSLSLFLDQAENSLSGAFRAT